MMKLAYAAALMATLWCSSQQFAGGSWSIRHSGQVGTPLVFGLLYALFETSAGLRTKGARGLDGD